MTGSLGNSVDNEVAYAIVTYIIGKFAI